MHYLLPLEPLELVVLLAVLLLEQVMTMELSGMVFLDF